MFQVKARILSNIQVAPDCFRMSLAAPAIAETARPGQFIQVRCNGPAGPLLRRPFGIHRTEEALSILYKVVGAGTRLLSEKKEAEELDIIGPLGNGFDFGLTTNAQRPTTILIGGGVGVAPLLFLAERLIMVQRKKNLLVLLGAKNKEQILCAEDFKKLGAEIRIATDDGSEGFKGTAATLLSNLRSTIPPEARLAKGGSDQRSTIYASGPKPMLKEIARISREEGISCQLSLEDIIACGFGVCLGCTVNTKEGYKLVCKDGPVFNSAQLLWE